MVTVPVMIPLADGEPLIDSVLDGVLNQTIPTLIIPVSRPRYTHKRMGEAICRNLIVDLVNGRKENYVMMMDSDVALFHINVIERALQRLFDDSKIGAVHVRTKPEPEGAHMDIGCVIAQRTVFAGLKFDPYIEDCHCDTFERHLGALGLRSIYLSNSQEATQVR